MAGPRRYNFFRLFALFFIIITPFLIVFSLGYDFDFGNKELRNSVSVFVDTLPLGSNVLVNNQLIMKSPGDLRIRDGVLSSIMIQRNGYEKESFGVWGSLNKNSSVRLNNMVLLPEEPQLLSSPRDEEVIKFLSSNKILVYSQKSNQYGIRVYSIAGLQNNYTPISSEIAEEIIQSRDIQFFGRDLLWLPEKKYILFSQNNVIQILDLSILPFDVSQFVSLSETEAIAVDTSNKSWVISIPSLAFGYVDSNVQAVAPFETNNDSIWVLSNSLLTQYPKNELISNFGSSGIVQYNLSPIIQDTSAINDLEVYKIFQGSIIKAGKTLIYVSDFDKQDIQIIARDVESMFAEGNSVFWIDEKSVLWTYNIFLENMVRITQLENTDLSHTKLSYFGEWRRILILDEDSLKSVWFDKDILNPSIINYYEVDWVSGLCYHQPLDRSVLCINDDKKLVAYANTNIF